jgi:hypothetical protein
LVEERLQAPEYSSPVAGTVRMEEEDRIHSDQKKPPITRADEAALLRIIRKQDGLLNKNETALRECEAELRECDADRSARLDSIHTLENLLRESEADRAARLEVIHHLERSNRDIQQRLNWMPVRALLKMRDKFKGGFSQP